MDSSHAAFVLVLGVGRCSDVLFFGSLAIEIGDVAKGGSFKEAMTYWQGRVAFWTTCGGLLAVKWASLWWITRMTAWW